MAKQDGRFELVQDRKGMVWDLLLYVPTVLILVAIGLKLWYSPNQNWSYLLLFLGSFFFFVGMNRILKTRLMIIPNAAVAFEIAKQHVRIFLRSGDQVDLVKDLRFFKEVGGKSFALTGIDLSGKKHQLIFHAGQFADRAHFNNARSLLEVYR
jgi:hypothetical protein